MAYFYHVQHVSGYVVDVFVELVRNRMDVVPKSDTTGENV